MRDAKVYFSVPTDTVPTQHARTYVLFQFNKSGDRAKVSEERKKRATINRTEVPKVSQEIALKREAVCGPSRAWSRPASGDAGEGDAEGKGEDKEGDDEKVTKRELT